MRILIASDGSASAAAALDAAIRFPWPRGSRARGVVALGRVRWSGSSEFGAAIARSLHASADDTRRKLRTHWADADVVELHEDPADAICSEAARFRCDAIVLGWRGQGTFARLLAGSVSRSVAERAKCSVLIAREGARMHGPLARRFAVGFDGSENSRKAIRFMARLQPPRGNRIVLVSVLEPLHAPPLSRSTAEVRAQVQQAIALQSAARLRQADKRLQRAADQLRRRGWHVTARALTGAPLHGLLAEASRSNGEALVIGARGTTGMARLLLGSVASGALNQSPLPVLIAR